MAAQEHTPKQLICKYIQFTRIMPQNINDTIIANRFTQDSIMKIFARPNYEFYFYEDAKGVLRFKNTIFGAAEEPLAGLLSTDSNGNTIIIGSAQARDPEFTVFELEDEDGYDSGTDELR